MAVRRERILVDNLDPRVQALVAATYFCGGPPAARYVMRSSTFYAAELLAELLDRPEELRGLIACGSSVIQANGWESHVVTLAPQVSNDREVRLLSMGVSPAPAFFSRHATEPAGLSDVRCLAKTGDACNDQGVTMARVDALGLVAVGALRDLIELADPGGTRLAEPKAARFRALAAQLDGSYDLQIFTPDADRTGLLDTADAWSDATVERRDAAMKALRAGDALLASIEAHSFVGKTSLVVELGAPSEAKKVQAALDAYRKAVASSTDQGAPANTPEERFHAAIAGASRRAFGKATGKLAGSRITIDADVALEGAERSDVDAYYASRKQRLDALGRVIAAVLDDRTPPDDDVLAVGGDALKRALRARAAPGTKERPDSKTISVGDVAVSIPVGGVPDESPQGIYVRYRGGSEATVEECFTVLRGDGFHLRVTALGSQGPVVEGTRGSSSFRLLVTKQERSVDFFFLKR